MTKYTLLTLFSLFCSTNTYAENLFVPYYGKYRIKNIECTLNSEKADFCHKWIQVEIKPDPINKNYMCVLMKSANSTSSDCYREENIVTDNSVRISYYTEIPNGAQFHQIAQIDAIERDYTMDLIENKNELIFIRDDKNYFPSTDQYANGLTTMTLRKMRP